MPYPSRTLASLCPVKRLRGRPHATRARSMSSWPMPVRLVTAVVFILVGAGAGELVGVGEQGDELPCLEALHPDERNRSCLFFHGRAIKELQNQTILLSLREQQFQMAQAEGFNAWGSIIIRLIRMFREGILTCEDGKAWNITQTNLLRKAYERRAKLEHEGYREGIARVSRGYREA